MTDTAAAPGGVRATDVADERREIGVTELVLRDAHQSLMATRMALEDMVDACADIDAAGYWSVECWGGATYDACIRFLNEDPWERLRTFRELMPNSRLQMLLRGQNLLGYRHYEDSVVDRFVERSASQRDGRLPGLRRPQRRPQHQAGGAGGAPRRQARPGHHLLHRESPAHGAGLRRHGARPDGAGLRLAVPQGHGRAAAAPAGLRHRPRDQGVGRRGRAHPRPLPRHDRSHAGQPDEGDRGRRRRRRHRDLVDLDGPRPQPHRVLGRAAPRDAVTAPTSTTSDCCASRSTSRRCGRATSRSCRPSPGSRPRSSRARSPAG